MRKDALKVFNDPRRAGPAKKNPNYDMILYRNRKPNVELVIDDDGNDEWEFVDDELPTKIGMRPRIAKGYTTVRRQNRTDLKFVSKYLRASTGKRWATVYSDICHSIKKNSKTSWMFFQVLRNDCGNNRFYGFVHDYGLSVDNYTTPYLSGRHYYRYLVRSGNRSIALAEYVVDNGILCGEPKKKQMNKGRLKGWDRRWIAHCMNRRKHKDSMERRMRKSEKKKKDAEADAILRNTYKRYEKTVDINESSEGYK